MTSYICCLGVTLGLVACGPIPLRLDEPVDTSKALALQDLKYLGERSDEEFVRSSDPLVRKAFANIFGGTSGRDVQHYFGERVRYVIGANERYAVFNRKSSTASIIDSQSDSGHVAQQNQAQVGAINIGTALWLSSVVQKASLVVRLAGSDELIDISSPRVGIVQLGAGYAAMRSGLNISPDPVTEIRLSVLIHEARHSDCTGGISQTDLDEASRVGSFLNFPPQSRCGQKHAMCPDWHPYKGAFACDDTPWGAYAVQAVYLEAQTTKDPFSDRSLLLRIVAYDSFLRLLYLSEPNQNLRNGKNFFEDFGDPDMSSAGFRD